MLHYILWVKPCSHRYSVVLQHCNQSNILSINSYSFICVVKYIKMRWFHNLFIYGIGCRTKFVIVWLSYSGLVLETLISDITGWRSICYIIIIKCNIHIYVCFIYLMWILAICKASALTEYCFCCIFVGILYCICFQCLLSNIIANSSCMG